MNRNDAKKIAVNITNEQLGDMLNAAKEGVTDWTKRSRINKGMTIGYSWNILAHDFDICRTYHNVIKTNMIWEFGDYLPNYLKPKKKEKRKLIKPAHQEPKFKKI